MGKDASWALRSREDRVRIKTGREPHMPIGALRRACRDSYFWEKMQVAWGLVGPLVEICNLWCSWALESAFVEKGNPMIDELSGEDFKAQEPSLEGRMS